MTLIWEKRWITPLKQARSPHQGCKISATETEAEIKFGYCTEFIIVLDKKFDA